MNFLEAAEVLVLVISGSLCWRHSKGPPRTLIKVLCLPSIVACSTVLVSRQIFPSHFLHIVRRQVLLLNVSEEEAKQMSHGREMLTQLKCHLLLLPVSWVPQL
jgi:hypothetical protein